MRSYVPIVAITMMISPVNAETAMDFYQHCGNGFKAAISGWCGTYVTGITNGLVDGHSGTVCLPHGVTAKQLLMVTQAYMRNHPETLNQEASLVIAQSMNEGFSCPEPSK